MLPAWTAAWGLGLGEIRIKSRFEKGFSAVIPLLTTDADTNIKITVGSNSDYELLQTTRPTFVGSLLLTLADDPDRPGNKAVIVTSPEPIPAISFNLVVRVSSGVDSVLENYFLAMDSKKNLSIDIPKPPPPPTETPIPPPKQAKKSSKSNQNAEDKKRGRKPEKPPASPKQKNAPSKPLVPPVGVSSGTSKPSAATGVVKIDPDPEKNKFVVRPGMTIFQIARTLNPAKADVKKVVAAIYLENKDKFVDGNINNFKAGVVITYNRVNQIAAALTPRDVTDVLSGIGRIPELPKLEEAPAAPPADSKKEIPAETAATDSEVTAMVEKWRADWETNSPGLADYYSGNFRSPDGGDKGAWAELKKQMVETNANVEITVENLRIARTGNLVGAHFVQTFESDRYSSTGRKKLLIRKFADGPRITGEFFVATRESDSRNVWAVAVSSHEDKDSAAQQISALPGITAYEAASFTGAPPYHVMAGRRNSKNAAVDLQKKLIKMGEKDAKVVRFPFSIRLAVFKDVKTSGKFMEQLKKDGYSPYRLGGKFGGKTMYMVYLGAFETKGAAENAITALAKSGLTPVVAVP